MPDREITRIFENTIVLMTGQNALSLRPLLPQFAKPDGENRSVLCGHPDFCPELVFCEEVHQLEAKGLGRRDIEA